MGSSASCSIEADVKFTDASWYDGRNGQEGNVYIRSCRVPAALGLGVHHCLVIDGCHNPGKWVVFEWTCEGGTSKFLHYATASIHGQNCGTCLGRHKLSKVYAAACAATNANLTYNSASNNCNHWTDRTGLCSTRLDGDKKLELRLCAVKEEDKRLLYDT